MKEGVQYETEYLTQRINNGLGYVQQGPRHVQAVLARLQKRIEETRLQALLEVSHFQFCSQFSALCSQLKLLFACCSASQQLH